MRIVLINYHVNKPNPVYEILAGALRKRGHSVVVAAPDAHGHLQWCGDNGDVVARIAAPESAATSKYAGRWGRLRMVLAARAVVKELGPDQVQVNSQSWPWLLSVFMPNGVYTTLDIRQINEAVDSHFRAALREKANLLSWRIWAKHLFDLTFFCHLEAAKHVLNGSWERYAEIIPVGVDEQFLEFDSSELASVEEGGPVKLVYIGTLSRLRNLERLIQAAALLRDKTEAFQLTLAGPDHTNGYLQGVVDRLGVADLVTIAPPIPYEDVPGFLAQHHVGLAYVPDRPTWHYQPTIKVLEYRALGLPILTTDVLSHRGIVVDGVNGVIVEDTSESVAEGMRRLVDDRIFLQEAARNARRMRQGRTWNDVAEMYERAYERISGRN